MTIDWKNRVESKYKGSAVSNGGHAFVAHHFLLFLMFILLSTPDKCSVKHPWDLGCSHLTLNGASSSRITWNFGRKLGYFAARINRYLNYTSTFQFTRIKLTRSGDVALNPGLDRCPVRFRSIARTHRVLRCDSCGLNYHIKCANVKPSKYIGLQQRADFTWNCPACRSLTMSTASGAIPPYWKKSSGVRFPCIFCEKACTKKQRALQCDQCDLWSHAKCTHVSVDEYNRLSASEDEWFCSACCLPGFTDSLFSSTDTSSVNSSLDSTDSQVDEISNFKTKVLSYYKYNLSIAHININSIWNKIDEVKLLLNEGLVDILAISETKLDSTYNNFLLQHPSLQDVEAGPEKGRWWFVSIHQEQAEVRASRYGVNMHRCEGS